MNKIIDSGVIYEGCYKPCVQAGSLRPALLALSFVEGSLSKGSQRSTVPELSCKIASQKIPSYRAASFWYIAYLAVFPHTAAPV